MEAHPQTIDADLRVALALAKGETNVGPWTGPGCTPEGYEAEDCQCCDALDPRRFNDSVEELIALGFFGGRAFVRSGTRAGVRLPQSSMLVGAIRFGS